MFESIKILGGNKSKLQEIIKSKESEYFSNPFYTAGIFTDTKEVFVKDEVLSDGFSVITGTPFNDPRFKELAERAILPLARDTVIGTKDGNYIYPCTFVFNFMTDGTIHVGGVIVHS